MRFKMILLFAIVVIALPFSEAHAACDCQDTNADGYPDRADNGSGAACTGSSVEEYIPASGHTQTISFDGTYTCGQFINGDYWVVAQGSPANVGISSFSDDGNSFAGGPNGSTIGWDVNPTRIIGGGDYANDPQRQGLDSRAYAYESKGNISSRDFVAGETVIIAGDPRDQASQGLGSGTCGDQSSKPWSCVGHVVALTVLDSPPSDPHRTFRPPYTGKWAAQATTGDPSCIVDPQENVGCEYTPDAVPKPQYKWSSIDTSYWVQRPCNQCTYSASKNPSASEIQASWASGILYDVVEHKREMDIRPHVRAVDNLGAYLSANYGGGFTNYTNGSYAEMLGECSSVSDLGSVCGKWFVDYIQTGIDYYHLIKDANRIFVGGGSHGPGSKILVWAATYWLNTAGSNAPNVGNDNPDMITWFSDVANQYESFSEDQQVLRRNIEAGVKTYFNKPSGHPARDPLTYNDLTGFDTSICSLFNNGNNDCTSEIVLWGQIWGAPRSDNYQPNNTQEAFFDTNCVNDKSIRDPYEYIDSVWQWQSGWSCGTYQSGNYANVNMSSFLGSIIPRLHAGGDAIWNSPEEFEFVTRLREYGYACEDTADSEASIGPHSWSNRNVCSPGARYPASPEADYPWPKKFTYINGNVGFENVLYYLYLEYRTVDPGSPGSGGGGATWEITSVSASPNSDTSSVTASVSASGSGGSGDVDWKLRCPSTSSPSWDEETTSSSTSFVFTATCTETSTGTGLVQATRDGVTDSRNFQLTIDAAPDAPLFTAHLVGTAAGVSDSIIDLEDGQSYSITQASFAGYSSVCIDVTPGDGTLSVGYSYSGPSGHSTSLLKTEDNSPPHQFHATSDGIYDTGGGNVLVLCGDTTDRGDLTAAGTHTLTITACTQDDFSTPVADCGSPEVTDTLSATINVVIPGSNLGGLYLKGAVAQ